MPGDFWVCKVRDRESGMCDAKQPAGSGAGGGPVYAADIMDEG